VAPADRDDVEVPVPVDVNHLCAIMVFVARMDDMLDPTRPLAIVVLKDIQPGTRRVRQVVLADDYVQVSVAIHVGHVQAHWPDDSRNHVLAPGDG
jgi:hypothetical protein